MSELCEFELERERLIEANKQKIKELELLSHAPGLKQVQLKLSQQPSKPKAPRRFQPPVPEEELRRSCREVKRPSYREEDYCEPLPLRQTRSLRGATRSALDSNEVDRIRREFAARTGQGHASTIIDSGLGVRVQGGRVYDSALGVTCHWCRQKTLCEHVICTNENCGGGRKLPVSFCKMCLMNRHGEDVDQAKASKCWVCPCCRGSCGPGCAGCCNCGPCRKKLGLQPTRQIVREAREAGFSNAHDYLIHLQTGESAEKIAARKHQFQWGAWLEAGQDQAEEEDESPKEGSQSDVQAADVKKTPAKAAPRGRVSDVFTAKKKTRREKASKAAEAAPPPIIRMTRSNSAALRIRA